MLAELSWQTLVGLRVCMFCATNESVLIAYFWGGGHQTEHFFARYCGLVVHKTLDCSMYRIYRT